MHEQGLLNKLSRAVIHKYGSWITIGIWILLAVVLNLTAPSLSSLYDNNATSSIGNQESVKAAQILQKEFPQQNDLPAIIVFYDAKGLSSQDIAQANQMACWLLPAAQQSQYKCDPGSIPVTWPGSIGAVISPLTTPQAESQLMSPDKTTLTIVAAITASPSDTTFSSKILSALQTYATDVAKANPQLQVKVTGAAGVIADLGSVFSNINGKILITTVTLVLILLLLIYRSPLLALLPIISVGVAMQVADPIIALIVKQGAFSVTAQAAGIRDVLLFGAGTDYVIFLVARYREELKHTINRRNALVTATTSVSEAITSSAGTVALALMVLLLATLGFYKTLGPLLAISVIVMLLIGLTFTPALMNILGKAAFWPFIPKPTVETAKDDIGKGLWASIASFVVKRPIISTVSSALLLGIFALGNIGVPAAYNQLTALRAPTQSSQGYAILAKHFAPGTLAPLSIVVQLKPGNSVYQQLTAIDQMTTAAQQTPNVAEADGPTQPSGQSIGISPSTLQSDFAALPDAIKSAIRSGQYSVSSSSGAPTGSSGPPSSAINPEIIGLYAASTQFVSADNSTVSLKVTLKTDPYGTVALDTMQPLLTAVQNAAKSAGLQTSFIGLSGITPTLADTRTVNSNDISFIIPIVLIIIAVILGLLLRSIVAPLYLLAAVSLNYAAALGISSFFFTRIQGDEGLSYAAPLYTFIFLVALGADYTIFLMTRVREETANLGLEAGVRLALSRTGGVITSAGLILAGTFAVLTTLPLRDLFQLGVTVATGILLDTFVVRGFLVPGIVTLLKDANWFPTKIKLRQQQTQ